MIDPTNTEPISVHRPTVRHALSLLAILALVVIAGIVIWRQDIFNDPEPVVVEKAIPLPRSEEKTEFTAIQDKVNSGEISREDAEREIQALFERTPTPTPPTN